METTPDNNYFSDRQENLKSLAPLFSSAGRFSADKSPKNSSLLSFKKQRISCCRCFSELPYMGVETETCLMLPSFPALLLLAYIRVLEKHGIPTGIIHKSVYDIYSRAYLPCRESSSSFSGRVNLGASTSASCGSTRSAPSRGNTRAIMW